MERRSLDEKTVFYITNYIEGTISVTNSINGNIINKIKTGLQPCDMVVEEGRVFVANSGSDNISIICNNKIIKNLDICNNGHIDIDLKKEKIYVSDINSVSAYDLYTHKCLKFIKNLNSVRFIKLNHFKNKLYVLYENNLNIYDSTTMNIIKSIKVGMGASFIEISTDDRTAYVSNTIDNSISIIDLNTMNIIASIEAVGRSPIGLKILGYKLYVACNLENSIKVIDTRINSIIESISVGIAPEKIALYNEKLIVNNTADNSLSIIDSVKNIVTNTINGFSEPMDIQVLNIKNLNNSCSFEKAECISSNIIFSNCSFRECFNHSTSSLSKSGIVGIEKEIATKYYIEDIKFLKGCVIPDSKQLTPLNDSNNYKLNFSFNVPYILKYKDISGNSFVLNESLKVINKELKIYIPPKRQESTISIFLDSYTKLLRTPIFNNCKFFFSVGIFVTVNICSEVDMLIPYISYCRKPIICEEYKCSCEKNYNDFYERNIPSDFYP